jgi:hypothetical protein
MREPRKALGPTSRAVVIREVNGGAERGGAAKDVACIEAVDNVVCYIDFLSGRYRSTLDAIRADCSRSVPNSATERRCKKLKPRGLYSLSLNRSGGTVP